MPGAIKSECLGGFVGIGTSEDEAERCIFGYTCVNDVTAADLIDKDPTFAQWARATPADFNRNGRPTSIGTGGRHQPGMPGRNRRNPQRGCARMRA